MSLFRNVITKLGNQVQQTAENVTQTVTQTVGSRVTQSLDAAIHSRLGNAVGEAINKTIGSGGPAAPAVLPAWSAKEFEKQIRQRLKAGVQSHVFFQRLMQGQLNPAQLHVWLANEGYCQQNLPLKDAAILSNCEDADFRRLWTQRLLEQDGEKSGQGAVDHWSELAIAQGMEADTLHEMTLVTPGVRFAMDTYINFARRAPWPEAVCASLSELAGVDHWKSLLESLNQHYQPVPAKTAEFFTTRATHARQHYEAALQTVTDYFKSRDDQEYALDILQFKHDILWTCLDSVSLSPQAQTDAEPAVFAPPVKGASPKRSPRRKKAESTARSVDETVAAEAATTGSAATKKAAKPKPVEPPVA